MKLKLGQFNCDKKSIVSPNATAYFWDMCSVKRCSLVELLTIEATALTTKKTVKVLIGPIVDAQPKIQQQVPHSLLAL